MGSYADRILHQAQFIEQQRAAKNYEFDDFDAVNAVSPNPRKIIPAHGPVATIGDPYPSKPPASLDLPRGYYQARAKMNKQQGR